MEESWGRKPSMRHPSRTSPGSQVLVDRGSRRASAELRSPHTDNDRHGRYGGYHNGSSRKQDLRNSLDDAVDDLLAVVNDAMDFYKHFEQDFYHDTQRISYVDAHTIGEIWMQKVRPIQKRPRDDRQSHSERSDDLSQGDRQASLSFRRMGKQLLKSINRAFEVAMSAKSSRSRDGSRYSLEEVSKIRYHLEKTSPSIERSLHAVHERVSEMQPLLTELEMFSLFLSRNKAHDGGHAQENQRRYHSLNDPLPEDFDRSDGGLEGEDGNGAPGRFNKSSKLRTY
ncbi:MAG: hypothetical protein Q9167_004458 [Letrouitia subvulpina]